MQIDRVILQGPSPSQTFHGENLSNCKLVIYAIEADGGWVISYKKNLDEGQYKNVPVGELGALVSL